MDITIFLAIIVIILILDFIWIGIVMNKFYTKQLLKIARKKGNKLKPNLLVSAIVYILLAGAIFFFVLPLAETNLDALILGGLMGLIIYGVYDLTNFSTLKDFSIKMTIIDLIWGAILCSLTSLIIKGVFL